MKCYLCTAELAWDSDHDYDLSDLYSIVSNFTCAQCGAHVVVYHPAEKDQKNGKNATH